MKMRYAGRVGVLGLLIGLRVAHAQPTNPVPITGPVTGPIALPIAGSQAAAGAESAPGAMSAASPAIAHIPFQKFTLSNGLTVILHEDHRTPQVAINMAYHIGSLNDPPGKRGMAHLFEHLMLRGSKHVGRDQFFAILARAGASDRNATTAFERTDYYETLPSNQLALGLWLESDRLGFFLDTFDRAMLEIEKGVVRSEHKINTIDAPYQLVSRYARNALYPLGHPAFWAVDGEMEELATISDTDIREFFKSYYVPNNATLTVAGDIEPTAALSLIQALLCVDPGACAARARSGEWAGGDRVRSAKSASGRTAYCNGKQRRGDPDHDRLARRHTL